MTVLANTSRWTRKTGLAVGAALVLLAAPLATAAPAHAAEADASATLARSPTLTPFDGSQERVHHNVSTERRNSLLNNCGPKYLCIAVGEGDGQHSVWELYYCTERTLSDFLGRGALHNRQYNNAVTRLLKRDKSVYALYWPTSSPAVVNDWTSVWYIDVC